MRTMLVSGIGGVVLAGSLLAAGGDKPKPTVTFAKTWEAAIEEAKLLNVPIVLHSHGFY